MFVTASGAGPPFSQLNFIPKSPFGPPGLCDAVRTIPPNVLYFRIIVDTAGVESTPFCPINSFDTCQIHLKLKRVTLIC